MELEFFNAKSLDRNLKATVHKTGKLGFTIEAAKKMQLEQGKSISIAKDKASPSDGSLYLVVHNDRKDSAFQVSKAGQYFYLNTKALFDTLGMNYTTSTIAYDLSEVTLNGTVMYKLKQRESKGRTSLLMF